MNATIDDVLEYIDRTDDLQLSEIIRAIIGRYNEVHPDWEISFLSLPKNDPVQQEQMLQSILQLYKQ